MPASASATRAAEAGRVRARQFSWDAAARATLRVYERATGRSLPATGAMA